MRISNVKCFVQAIRVLKRKEIKEDVSEIQAVHKMGRKFYACCTLTCTLSTHLEYYSKIYTNKETTNKFVTIFSDSHYSGYNENAITSRILHERNKKIRN